MPLLVLLVLLESFLAGFVVVALCLVWLVGAWLWLGAPHPSSLLADWASDRPVPRGLFLPLATVWLIAPLTAALRALDATVTSLRGGSPAVLLRPIGVWLDRSGR